MSVHDQTRSNISMTLFQVAIVSDTQLLELLVAAGHLHMPTATRPFVVVKVVSNNQCQRRDLLLTCRSHGADANPVQKSSL